MKRTATTDLSGDMAASHAFAQSARLEPFAESVQKSIEDTRFLAAELAATGITLS